MQVERPLSYRNKYQSVVGWGVNGRNEKLK